jgi:hypothetical protein
MKYEICRVDGLYSSFELFVSAIRSRNFLPLKEDMYVPSMLTFLLVHKIVNEATSSIAGLFEVVVVIHL